MKILVSAIFCALFLFVSNSQAQVEKKPEEPEYIGVFFFLNEGKLSGLERQKPDTKVKVKGMGFGGAESLLQINGERSPVRFKSDQTLELVVRVTSQATDPMSLIQFFRFEAKKGMRRLQLAKAGSMGMNGKSTINQNAVSFNAVKYGESSFKIVPANDLGPGEYCLSGQGNQDAFCFGIDAAIVSK